MSKVSIIIPVYNAAPFLRKCIESIQLQKVVDIEVILVNDGSKDNSLEICKEFAAADSRVKVIDKPNGGVSDARNYGINNASGEYLMFVDADDWLSADALELLTPYMDKYDIIRGSAYAVYPSKTRRYKLGRFTDKEKIIKAIISRNTIVACWGALFHRELFTKNNITFDSNLNVGEDWVVTAKTARFCKSIKLLPEVYCYHYNKENFGSCTQTMSSEKIMKQFEALDMIRKIFPTGHESEFSFTKCLFIQELIDNCGLSEAREILHQANKELTSYDILNILTANISIRKKIMLLRLWISN